MIDFVDPETKAKLRLLPDGSAYVSKGGNSFPIKDGIPIFSVEIYTENFGDQWNDFPLTQIDSSNIDKVSEERLVQTFGFTLDKLAGKSILEVGSGAGRFTEVLLRHGAMVYSCDASNAIIANSRNNKDKGIGVFFQASVFNLPLPPRKFDVVFCIGVIQHLPDASKGISCLAECVKPGGSLFIDHYRWQIFRRLAPRYLIGRPITSRLPTSVNRNIAKAFVNIWWPLRFIFSYEILRKIATTLSPVAPIAYYKRMYKGASDEKLKELAVLDTNDFISARYDKGLTRQALKKILKSTNCSSCEVLTNHELADQYGTLRAAGLVARASYD